MVLQEDLLDFVYDRAIMLEGAREFPYTDGDGKPIKGGGRGFITIGVGRCLEKVPLSKDEIKFLFGNDFRRAVKGVMKLTDQHSPPHRGWDFAQARKAALVDMAFNLGVSGLASFTKMWKAFEARDWNEVAIQALDSKWAKQVGQRAIENAEMLRTGEVPGD